MRVNHTILSQHLAVPSLPQHCTSLDGRSVWDKLPVVWLWPLPEGWHRREGQGRQQPWHSQRALSALLQGFNSKLKGWLIHAV